MDRSFTPVAEIIKNYFPAVSRSTRWSGGIWSSREEAGGSPLLSDTNSGMVSFVALVVKKNHKGHQRKQRRSRQKPLLRKAASQCRCWHCGGFCQKMLF